MPDRDARDAPTEKPEPGEERARSHGRLYVVLVGKVAAYRQSLAASIEAEDPTIAISAHGSTVSEAVEAESEPDALIIDVSPSDALHSIRSARAATRAPI